MTDATLLANFTTDPQASKLLQVSGPSVTISANTLFHFTMTKENLIGILRNEFYPRYCLEKDAFSGESYEEPSTAIPMVSFCDIPLSQIKNHIQLYGKYAIGLNKDWGKRNKISPILYTYPESSLSDSFLKIARNSVGSLLNKKHPCGSHEITTYISYFKYFIKPYEGKIFRDGKYSDGIIRFYDEREWRYVPTIKALNECGIHKDISKEEFFNKKYIASCNKSLEKHCRLSFSPRDIKYIILKNESEIIELMDVIADIKGDKYSYNDVKLLSSRLLTIDQVMEDF